MDFKKISEKTAYLKGLMEGLGKEDKVTALIAEILGDIAGELEEAQDDICELYEAVDTLDEDLGGLEQDYYELDEEDECGCGHHHHDFDECCDDDEDEDDEELFDDEELYEVTCPTCSDTICLNEAMIDEGSITCPNCGELLEFDFDDSEEESEE